MTKEDLSTRKKKKKFVPAPIRPPKIPYGLTWDLTHVSDGVRIKIPLYP